jgi:hypothetical protein
MSESTAMACNGDASTRDWHLKAVWHAQCILISELGTHLADVERAPQRAAAGRRRRMAAAAAPLQRGIAAGAARSSPGVLAGLLLRPGHPASRLALAAARQSRRTPRAPPPLGGRS